MNDFKDAALPNEIKLALDDLGFKEPTEIQGLVLPKAIEGLDIMACAETGSGKTAAFAIPLVMKLLTEIDCTGLILAPTRELVFQIAEFIQKLTKHCKNMGVVSLVGGEDIKKQFKALRRRPKIVVATPGRLSDHIRRETVRLHTTSILVLDEGDRMLDMGFAPQLDEILEFVPEFRQTLLFTATLPEKVQKLARNYLTEPTKVNAGRTSLPVAAIKQSVIPVDLDDKQEKIQEELQKRNGSIIVFTRTKRRTDVLARVLGKSGHKVDLIHGGRSQMQRNKAIKNFKNGKCDILVATDVAARGIDVPEVGHVINYDLPRQIEDYVHRIGRTARNGAKGEALTFVTPEEIHVWQQIVKKYKIVGLDLKNKKIRRNSRDRNPFNKPKAKTESSSRAKEKSGKFSDSNRKKKSKSRDNSLEDSRPKKRSAFKSRSESSQRSDEKAGSRKRPSSKSRSDSSARSEEKLESRKRPSSKSRSKKRDSKRDSYKDGAKKKSSSRKKPYFKTEEFRKNQRKKMAKRRFEAS